MRPTLKYKNEYPITLIDGLEKAIDDLKGKEISSFTIAYIFNLGEKFESGRKFIEIIENMLIDFYSGVVQFIVNPPPKMPQIKSEDEHGKPLAPLESTANTPIEKSVDL